MKQTAIQSGSSQGLSRRDFIQQSSKVVAGAALAQAIAVRSYAAENNTIKIALVGCGGRGTGAAENALQTSGPTQLWAVADAFPWQAENSLKTLGAKFQKKAEVPPERRFIGLDGFKKAIDSLDKGDVVLLTTPPGFRPIHLEYAVQKGVNVFMEKSFAVDAPGIRRVRRAGELASQKNLKIAGGLMSRHNKPLEEAIQQIHNGALGDIITCWAYRVHGPVGFRGREIKKKEIDHPAGPWHHKPIRTRQEATMSEIGHQIQNYSNYTWLNGSFIVDWLIHNIDVCCWIKNSWPESVQGMGGRQVRDEADQLFDHYGAEYSFADGTRLFAQGRHIANCWEFFGDVIHGTKGSAVLGEGITNPRLYKGHKQTEENQIWKYEGAPCNPYQVEHDLFFDAIRNDKPYNETERCIKTCLTAIMGRMACESGKRITYDEALNSNRELAPGLEKLTLESKAPVEPDSKGAYPVAKPGKTEVL